jgi:hypothetical protein
VEREESQVSEIVVTVGSVEYLYADVTADRELDSQPVEMAVDTNPASADWAEATWVGDPGLTRSCRILLDGTLAAGKYSVYVRITDTPEVPVVKAGVLRVRVQ